MHLFTLDYDFRFRQMSCRAREYSIDANAFRHFSSIGAGRIYFDAAEATSGLRFGPHGNCIDILRQKAGLMPNATTIITIIFLLNIYIFPTYIQYDVILSPPAYSDGPQLLSLRASRR